MNRRVVLALAIVLALVATAGLVVAEPWQGESNDVIGSEHETSSDFDEGELDGLINQDNQLLHDRWQDYQQSTTVSGASDGDVSTTLATQDALYFGDGSGSGPGAVTSVDAVDHTVNWETNTGSITRGLAADDATVWAANNQNEIYAIDKATGDGTVEATRPGFVRGLGYDDQNDQLIAVESDDPDRVVALDPDTLEEDWSTDLDDAPINVAVSDGEIYVVTVSSLTKYDSNGNQQWSETGDFEDVAVGSDVYAVSNDAVNAFDSATGNSVWTEATGGEELESVTANQQTVFAGEGDTVVDDATVFGVDEMGNQKWQATPDSDASRLRSMSSNDRALVIGDDEDKATIADATTTSEYVSQAHAVSGDATGEVEINSEQMEATVTWEGWDGSDWSVVDQQTTTTETTAELTGYDEYRVSVAFNANTGASTFSATHDRDAVSFENDAPVLSDPDPEEGTFVDDRSQVDLSVDVDDEQFGDSQGEEVEVTFYDASDDSVIGSDTVTEPDRASTTWSGVEMGQNSWYAVAEDDWGGTTETSTLTFETPSELEIRDETAPDELVTTESEVEVTFFDDDDVITRTTTDGVVDLEGLPADQAFVVQVEADGYVTRQSIIPSITQQQEVYLLPGDVESVSVRFDVDDSTGSFPPEDTRILIEKPLTRDGETRYKLIAGDDYGAQGFSTVLQIDQRYRAIVENTETGQRQSLGPYVASQSETVTLQVDSIAFDTEVEEIGYRWGADYQNATDSEPRVGFGFEADNEIESLTVTIRERGGDEQILLSESFNNVQQVNEIADLGDIENPDETTYVVEWEATVIDEDGQAFDVSGSEIVGADQLPVDIPGVGDDVLHVVSVLLLFLLGGLFSAANVEIGAVVVSLTAAAFWLIGMLPGVVSGLFIGAALLLSVMWMVRNARGEQ